MTLKIDFYYLSDSEFVNNFKTMIDPKQFEINFRDQSLVQESVGHDPDIVLFEEESFITSIDIFKRIKSLYQKVAVFIVFSKNSDVFNVVQWMREGASDYLVQGQLNSDIFGNSIADSLAYHKKNNSAAVNKKIGAGSIQNKPILPPKGINWKELRDDEFYQLTAVMFEVIFKTGNHSHYSEELKDKINARIMQEASRIAQSMGGKLWFWNNNVGCLIFHFGDAVNCAVLSAIKIFMNFFLLCIQTLKLNELLHVKVAVHTGIGLYHATKTDQITSDLINSIAHLIKMDSGQDKLLVTSDIYKDLNPRLIKNFKLKMEFEERKIYEYQFYKY